MVLKLKLPMVFFIALVENGSRRYLPQRICFKALTFWTPYYNLLCCCWEMAKAIVSLVPFSKWVSYWPYVFRWVFWGNQHTKLLDRNEWIADLPKIIKGTAKWISDRSSDLLELSHQMTNFVCWFLIIYSLLTALACWEHKLVLHKLKVKKKTILCSCATNLFKSW